MCVSQGLTHNLRSDPYGSFVLYGFETEEAARAALLALPCVHTAEDSGKLICTEVLVFGHYPAETGGYEAIVAGDDLTHELWEKALASFEQHGGSPRGEGDLEPAKREVVSERTAEPAGKVEFLREDREVKMGHTMTYRIHRAPSAAAARSFLEGNPVTRQLYYMVVETPAGNYCRDIQGIYKE